MIASLISILIYIIILVYTWENKEKEIIRDKLFIANILAAVFLLLFIIGLILLDKYEKHAVF